jgi:hypothetical protein
MAALTVLATLVFVGTTSAAPAPKATGGYGYSFGGVQRQVSFAAIQANTNTCGTFWTIAGSKQFTFNLNGTDYDHAATLAQNGQIVTGSGAYAGTPSNTWTVNPGSTVVGNTLTLTWNYVTPDSLVNPVQYVMSMSGTIAANGSISGTWSQTGGSAGTFTAPAGTATALVSYCGKGTFSYDDEQGNWYLGVVKTVSVSGKDAWYAVQILASNLGYETSSTPYLFVKVTDNAEPGIGNDVTGGDLMTAADATNAVAGHLTPSTSAVINAGNIQVH